MAVSLRQLKAFKQRQEIFEADPNAWRYPGEIVMRQKLTQWQRHAKWLSQFNLAGRAVVVIAEITIAYMLFLFGALISLGLLAFW